jgi:acetyl-CoA carboxylase carboxyl transferase subunit alpha
VVLGEGGSGGALAIGIGDRVLMMENAVYSVISPEGCAAILWKDAGKADLAAAALRLTAADLMRFGVIDEIVAEDGAWEIDTAVEDDANRKTGFSRTADRLKQSIVRNLDELVKLSPNDLVQSRYQKFRKLGTSA